MKKILTLLLSTLLLFVAQSCIEHDQLGLPETLHFSQRGGEVTLTPNNSLAHVQILDYNGNYEPFKVEVHDTIMIVVHYEWLSVKHTLESRELKFIATPNTSGKKRTLYVDVFDGYAKATLKVEQDK